MATLTTGVISGILLYGAVNILPTFGSLEPGVHLQFRAGLVRHTGVIMPLLMMGTIIFSLLYAFRLKRKLYLSKMLAYTAGILSFVSFLTSIFGIYPINEMIISWPPDAPPAYWEAMLYKWDTFHIIRTLASSAAFVCLLGSDLFLRPAPKRVKIEREENVTN